MSEEEGAQAADETALPQNEEQDAQHMIGGNAENHQQNQGAE